MKGLIQGVRTNALSLSLSPHSLSPSLVKMELSPPSREHLLENEEYFTSATSSSLFTLHSSLFTLWLSSQRKDRNARTALPTTEAVAEFGLSLYSRVSSFSSAGF